MITVGISQRNEYGEYRVFWQENGRDVEDRANYQDDPEAAVYTLIDILQRFPEARMTGARHTVNLISKYRPDFLMSETRRVLQAEGFSDIDEALEGQGRYEV